MFDNKIFAKIEALFYKKEVLWSQFWLAGVLFLFLWDFLFLNSPANIQLWQAFFTTIMIAVISALISFFVALSASLFSSFSFVYGAKYISIAITTVNNIFRSIPQVLGVLASYFVITVLSANGSVTSSFYQIMLLAVMISLFIYVEVATLMEERINHYKKSDFYPAMLSCGISEFRIILVDVLYKNSAAHILQKLVSVFGMTIFLQCSVDFIVSVGLSTDVSLLNMPITLGGLLAKMDSKQDILAIGHSIMNPSYALNIPFKHLQGISTAFLIVFTILCLNKISAGLVKRFKLY